MNRRSFMKTCLGGVIGAVVGPFVVRGETLEGLQVTTYPITSVDSRLFVIDGSRGMFYEGRQKVRKPNIVYSDALPAGIHSFDCEQIACRAPSSQVHPIFLLWDEMCEMATKIFGPTFGHTLQIRPDPNPRWADLGYKFYCMMIWPTTFWGLI